MAYVAPSVNLVGNNLIRINHPGLLEPKTYLTVLANAGETTLTVAGNAGFSNTDPQDLLLFGALGTENAEIKRINGAISAGTSLTVQALTFAHGIDTPVNKILFDQVEISGAATAAGSKTVIDTINIRVGDSVTDFVVTGSTYAYYFVRFKNSLSTTPYFGDYSDALLAAGFDPKNVGFIIRNAFENVGEKPGEGIFGYQWIYDQIYLGELEVTKTLPRWSWLRIDDYDAGNSATGDSGFTLPTNIEDKRTNKSILGVRIGTGENMNYIDQAEFQSRRNGVALSTLSVTATIGATSFTLADSRDYADAGSVNIAGTTYAYTLNTRSTGVLSGITAIPAEITAGANVWQNVTFAEPFEYTVTDGEVKFTYPVSSSFNGMNYWIDYYSTVTRVNSDGDTITVNDPYLIQLWLEMKIKAKKDAGKLSANDFTVLEYQKRSALLIRNERSGQSLSLVPGVPSIARRRGRTLWR
jgi:hypothetical protein